MLERGTSTRARSSHAGDRRDLANLSPTVTRYVSASVAHLQCCYGACEDPCRCALNMRAGVGAAMRDSTRVLTSSGQGATRGVSRPTEGKK